MWHCSSFRMKSLLLAISCVCLCTSGAVAVYTEETPVKLLYVESVATRYPAADSEYRTSLNGGHVSSKIRHWMLLTFSLFRMRMPTQQRMKALMITQP